MQSTPLNPSSGRPDPDELLTHVDWLRRLARALVRDEASAEDLVQDAMGAAVATRTPIRDVRGFLAGTVRRLASRGRRGDARRERRERDVAADRDLELPAADTLAERVDTLRIVLEELRELPAAQQRAVSLRYLEDLGPSEIARREGSTPSTVRSHLTRGLAALRERLDRRAGGRNAWCAVLAPFAGHGAPLAPGPGGEVPVPDPSPAVSTAGLAGALGATGVFAMTLKTISFTLVPIALAGAWYASTDRGTDIDSTLARPSAEFSTPSAQLAGVEVREETTRSTLDADAAQSGTATIAESAASPTATEGPESARLEGTIVDAITGEPVPFVDIIVVETIPDEAGQLRSVGATTDATGAFVDPFGILPAGEVEVTILDDHGGLMTAPRKQTLAFPFKEPIAARVGPTFHVSLPADVDPAASSYTVRYALEDEKYRNRPIDAILRMDGGTPWVRFGPLALGIEGDGPWTLELSGQEGLRTGTAEVRRKSGVEPFPVHFDMDPRGVIEFSLALGNGAQLPAARVDVHPVGDEDDVQRVFLGSHDANGTMRGRYRLASPGRYAWTFGLDDSAARGEVEVAAGEVTRVDLSLEDFGQTFETHVLLDLTAAPGAKPNGWRTFVVREDDPSSGFMTLPTRDESDPGGYWRIELKSLVDGRWTVGVDPGADFDLEPGSVSVGPGDPAAVIKVTPGAPRVPVRVRVVDATTGEAIPGAEAAYMSGVIDSGQFMRSGSGLKPEPLKANAETTIIVRAGGYRATEFQHHPGRDGTELEARLTRGWANRVVVLDMSIMDVVAGVTVHVDGKYAGKTGDDGALWLTTDGPPEWIEVGTGDVGLEVVNSPFRPGAVSPPDSLMGYAFIVTRR